MTEVWKDIPGYEDNYQISNLGNIRSKERDYFQLSRHGWMMVKHYKSQKINPFDNGNGYLMVSLRRQGENRKNYYIHRLVAEAFIPNPDCRKEVNHIDYNKHNNAIWNLEWATRNENIDWSKEHSRKPKKTSRKTNIGMRYISMRKGMYRVNIRNKREGFSIDKSFTTLAEAITAKESFINGKEYFTR